jgi:hypothetical protein
MNPPDSYLLFVGIVHAPFNPEASGGGDYMSANFQKST